ncbi:MAG: TrmH family RNA methyltransferase [Chitinispirillaceae bacterium]
MSDDRVIKPLSWYKSLSLSKHRRRSGFFLIEGKRAVEQVLSFSQSSVDELLCTEEQAGLAQSYAVAYRIVSYQKMKSICISRTPQGVAAVVRLPLHVYSSEMPSELGEKILLLEDLQDPGNVGSLVRSAAALGYGGCILSGKCADPFSPKSVQSTAGSILSLWIRRTESYLELFSKLKAQGYKAVSADIDGREQVDFSAISKHVLALGSEGKGLSGELLSDSDYVYRIPISDSAVESLNVAASGAICMFMCSQRMRLSPDSAQQG